MFILVCVFMFIFILHIYIYIYIYYLLFIFMITFIFVNNLYYLILYYYTIVGFYSWQYDVFTELLTLSDWAAGVLEEPLRTQSQHDGRGMAWTPWPWWLQTDGHRWWNIRWLHPCSPVNIYIKLWKSMDFPYRWWIFYLSLLEGKMYDELYTDDFQYSPKVGNTFLKMGFYAREIKG